RARSAGEADAGDGRVAAPVFRVDVQLVEGRRLPRLKCGSFARIGLPVSVTEPSTTHSFEPRTPRPRMARMAGCPISLAMNSRDFWTASLRGDGCAPDGGVRLLTTVCRGLQRGRAPLGGRPCQPGPL